MKIGQDRNPRYVCVCVCVCVCVSVDESINLCNLPWKQSGSMNKKPVKKICPNDHSAWWRGTTGVWAFDYDAQSKSPATWADSHYIGGTMIQEIPYGPSAGSNW